MAKAEKAAAAVEDTSAVEPAPVVEPAPPAIPVVKQPTEPVGLPTGNPWDLAYPIGHTPPDVREGRGEGKDTTDPGAGFVGVQVGDHPSADLDVIVASAITEEQ